MHKHKWTPWEYTNHDHEYFLDGYYTKTKYEHGSWCTVCGKTRFRKFRTIYVNMRY